MDIHECLKNCHCNKSIHETRYIVITGGPGAGKTAVLELARKALCKHVMIIPEGASIIFAGGFIRLPTPPAIRAAQRAIFHIQAEQERLVLEEKRFSLGLCDRGSLDGLAYWPGTESEYFKELGTTKEKEYAKYSAVIHLRTPTTGYNHQNPIRTETNEQALEIDKKIEKIWSGHPQRVIIESNGDFIPKAQMALQAIFSHVPPCCITP